MCPRRAAVPALACPFPARPLPSRARWEGCPWGRHRQPGSLAGAPGDPSALGEVKADLAATSAVGKLSLMLFRLNEKQRAGEMNRSQLCWYPLDENILLQALQKITMF